MTTPNRPPMTVWASEDINAPVMGGGGPKRGHWCSVRSQVFRHGPYVHLEQFMEELLELLRLVDEVTGWENDLIDTNEFSEDGEAMINDIGNLREYAAILRKEIRG